MSLLVVGSVALDSVETPTQRRDDVLGGSAVFFSYAASYFTGVKLVGGYEFGNGFSLEAGYIGFGKFSAADGTVGLTHNPTAITLGGAFALPRGSDRGRNVRLAHVCAPFAQSLDTKIVRQSG